MTETRINIEHIPFSRYGCMLSVTRTAGKNELVIHQVRQPFDADARFRVIVLPEGYDRVPAPGCPDGDLGGLPFTAEAAPSLLKITAEGGSAEFCMVGDYILNVRTHGLTLGLFSRCNYGYGILRADGSYEGIDNNIHMYNMARCLRGSLTAKGPFAQRYGNPFDLKMHLTLAPADEDGEAEMELQINMTEERVDPVLSREEAIANTDAEWQAFLAKMPPVPEEHRAFAQVTWYNLWSSYVRAQDNYPTDVMLMSKKYMDSVWSWDHCFNAMAIAYTGDPAMAFNQFYAPYWHQNGVGALPDMWNPNLQVQYSITKPPVHGWSFGKLMDRFDFDAETLEKAYAGLKKQTEWWMTLRDENNNGIPGYPQGNDSGWDNATVFDVDYFMETPDLPALLVLQMHTLARIADRLGRAEEAADWRAQAQALLDRMLAFCWDGEKFVTHSTVTGKAVEDSLCLLDLMPLVLGEYLPKEIADRTTEKMERENLTEFGLATESPSSAKYESDGYWRGPIWAPTTYLIVDGLNRMGKTELAAEIARRFCRMCAFTAEGNYENFDALTGKGLRAPGYTWTASVYMLLLLEYLA